MYMKRFIGLLTISLILIFCTEAPGIPIPKIWKLNTSNKIKLAELNRLFADRGWKILSTNIDLHEIDADPIKVVVHKASQIGEQILVEDTSLEIDGADVGVNLKWMTNRLTEHIGKKAKWIVLLAYRVEDIVVIHQGMIPGKIVSPQGGTDFEAVFLPDGASETLAQSKPDCFNARAVAVQSLLEAPPAAIEPVITSWEGSWQPSK